MKVVASTDEYTIYLRRDGRHAVVGSDKAPINGDAKVEILLAHELITAAVPKPADPEPEDSAEAEADASSEEDVAEESSEEGGEEGGEEEKED
ncbi:MAG: hypothetical protein AAF541_20595 [Pseudomonadota bacterium]